ncbi:MAG: hypothetical protein RBT42_07980 [Aquabacterium sp.]|jgi:hypothetical protein|uniref:hypothetical protein n=1 Tax=Aquabacterium sp. TaxID=1872578 RepID=UPI002A372436|nr:hypothetical protein [Aquabacterium sp.]MDX9843682.1 hypothetical protein [Aquabacterium sp.]
MIKIHSNRLSHRWLYLAAAGLCLAIVGHFWLDQGAEAVGTVEAQNVSASSLPNTADISVTMGAAPMVKSGLEGPAPQGEDEGDDESTALETGMEDWQKPENVALRAELQRWYDHREETSMAQRRADASALMAQVEARQAAGKISETSAALAKLMLLQGAPSDDPQHAAHLQEVMALLAGRLSFGE